MPQLGESVTEGTIAKWLKKTGEPVAKYESIAEVVTDKVNAEIPAPADGVMGEIVAPEGTVVAVGQPICHIESGSGGGPTESGASEPKNGSAGAAPAPQPAPPQRQEPAPAPAPEPQAQAPAPAPKSAPAATQSAPAPSRESNGGVAGGEHHVTPAVRALVREHGVNLDEIKGSGFGGRITAKDVMDFVQRGGAPAAPAKAGPATAPAPQVAPAPSAPSAAPAQTAATPVTRAEGDELLAMTSVRRAIAEHMSRSKQVSPHAWLMMEVDMSRVVHLRERHKQEFKERYGVSLTYLPFVARATVEALRRHPTMNAQWSDEGVVLKRDVHLGIAVALEENLIVPVVRNADRLSISGLAQTMSDLGERSRSNHLKLDEIQGGTFTLNNTGALGTVLTAAIINQPQAGILCMDAIVKRPVVMDNDGIAVRPIMNLTLSFDHRINDGLQAARFVKEVKTLLESIDENSSLL